MANIIINNYPIKKVCNQVSNIQAIVYWKCINCILEIYSIGRHLERYYCLLELKVVYTTTVELIEIYYILYIFRVTI